MIAHQDGQFGDRDRVFQEPAKIAVVIVLSSRSQTVGFHQIRIIEDLFHQFF